MARHDDSTETPAPSAGKGRPTPKRREAERGRRQPVAAPATGREAARLRRLEQVQARERLKKAWVTGDENNMPARDRGPVRRYTRDNVDSRITIIEWYVPIAIPIYAMSFIPATRVIGLIAMEFLLLFGLLEATVIGLQLRRKLNKKFPDASRKGAIRYGLLRAVYPRRFRLPKPQVKRLQDVG